MLQERKGDCVSNIGSIVDQVRWIDVLRGTGIRPRLLRLSSLFGKKLLV